MSYAAEIAALESITAGQTLDEASHADRHNQGNAASVALAAHLDALEAKRPAANVRLSIVEYAAGSWSGDAPPGRAGAQNPILFTPYDPTAVTDPADGVNGIATPSNLRDWDLIGPVPGAVTVAPPAPEPGVIAHGTDLRREDVGLTSEESELTTVAGPIESTAANEVIENKRVTFSTTFGDVGASSAFAVVVKHDGVTVRNCKIEHDGPSNGIQVISGVKNVTIEHCHFDGMSPTYGSNRIPGDPNNANQGNAAYHYVAGNEGGLSRRNFITGVRSGNRVRSYGVTVRENWVDYLHRNWSGVSMSSVAPPYGSWGSPEYVVIERNRLIAGSSAAVTNYPFSGPLRNVRVVDNLVIGVGDGFGIRGGRSQTENGNYCHNSNIKIEGNRFRGEFAYPNTVGEGTNAGVDLSRPGNTFTNNRWLPGHGTITGDLPARCGVVQNACDGPACP